MTDDIVKCGLCDMEVLATHADITAHAEFHWQMRYIVLESCNIFDSGEPIIFKRFN
jgi:hypothetical protein